MSVTLDATVGGASSNSYATVVEADAYHENRLHNEIWTAAQTTNKQRALIMATRLLDEHVRWKGYVPGTTQALQWPRLGVANRNGILFTTDAIPQFLKDATAEFARILLPEDPTMEPEGQGISSATLPGGESFVRDKHDKKKPIPDAVMSMIRPYMDGLYSSMAVKLVRT